MKRLIHCLQILLLACYPILYPEASPADSIVERTPLLDYKGDPEDLALKPELLNKGYRPISNSEGYGDVEIHLHQDPIEAETTHAMWTASLPDWTFLETVFYPNTERVWYRIPQHAILPPHSRGNPTEMYRVDLTIHSLNPGFIGRLPLAGYFEVDQHPLSFPATFYFDKTSARAHFDLPSGGQSPFANTQLDIDEEFPVPVIYVHLRSQPETRKILKQRQQVRKDGYEMMPDTNTTEPWDDTDFDTTPSELLPMDQKSDGKAFSRDELRDAALARKLNAMIDSESEKEPALLMFLLGTVQIAPRLIDPTLSAAEPQIEYIFSWSH